VTSPERPADGIDGRRAWVIAIANAVAVGLGFGTASSFGTFFGEMADDLGADATSGQFLPIGVALLFTIAGAVVTLAIPGGAPVVENDVDVALTQS